MTGVDGASVSAPPDGAAADSWYARRRTQLIWAVVAGAVAIALGVCASRGLSPSDVEARVGDVVRSHPDSTRGELARAIADEFTDSKPTYRGSDGAAFSPVRDGGIVGAPLVRRVGNAGTVRAVIVYAEAPVIPTGWGDMYCLVIDVPVEGPTQRAAVEADFTRPDHCAHAHREVAAP